MGLIPFLGDDSDTDEDGFKSNLSGLADKTALSRGEQKESNDEIAEMHKSRSKKAFEENEQFSGSSGEWQKVSDSQESFSNNDQGETQDFRSQRGGDDSVEGNFQSQNTEESGRNNEGQSRGQDLKEGFKQMDQTLQDTVEKASKMKQEFQREDSSGQKNDSNLKSPAQDQNDNAGSFEQNRDKATQPVEQTQDDFNNELNKDEDFSEASRESLESRFNDQQKSVDAETDEVMNKDSDTPESSEVADSLEENISVIKERIDSGDISKEEIEGLASRFEELVDRLEELDSNEASHETEDMGSFEDEIYSVKDEMDEKISSLGDQVEEELESFREELDDLESLKEEITEIRERQSLLDEKYVEIESAVTDASEEEGDIRVEDIETIERLDKLEEEIDDIKSGDIDEASEQVHMDALENEVKELRNDVRELSEAVVTISEKVFR